MTRSQNSFLNIVTGLFSSLLIPLLNFVVRRVFLDTLGMSYLGIEGVFSNILSTLSIADFGFSTAIGYMLYQPIEEQDQPRIQALMHLYKQIYRVVGLAVLVLGLCLIPALPPLVKDYGRFAQLGLNAVLIYMLYLLNNVSSYWFFAYKETLVAVSQKTYLVTIGGYVLNIAAAAVKITLLLTTKNFMLYLAAHILFSMLQGLMKAVICDRRYPYARRKPTVVISREERRDIFHKCYAVFFHRINGTVLNTSDTLVLSAFAGLDAVGLYGNYLAIKIAVQNIISNILYSVQASIGSIFTAGRPEWSRLLFRTTHMLTFFLFGVGGIGTAVLINDCLAMLFGPEFVVTSWLRGDVLVATPLALLIGVEVYFSGFAVHVDLFRSTSGLFQDLRYRPILTILVNLIVSLVTVPLWGMSGCVLGTIAAYALTETLIDPIVICRRALDISPASYFGRQALYAAVTVAAGLLSWRICAWLVIPVPLLAFLAHGCVCVLVPGAIFALLSWRTEEFRFLLRTLRDVLRPSGRAEKN